MASSRQAWEIVPRLSLGETITDNALPGGLVKKSDQVTEITPGVRISGMTARAKLHLDYQLRDLIYAQGSRGNTIQNTLNSFGTLEAIEKLLFVDASGVVTQQTISAFGTQSAANYSINSNATATSNFRVSPYLRGRLGGYADYEARYSKSIIRAKGTAQYDTDIDEWSGRVAGRTPMTGLGWSLHASQQTYDYSAGRKSESDRWYGLVSYKFDPQWNASISGGRERNDFSVLQKDGWGTYGYGIDWAPTERTQISGFREKRFFGHGHRVSISHRMPSSAVSYTDVRDVTALPNQLAIVGLGTYYDLFFMQWASREPNEQLRADAVNKLLKDNGIPSNAQITGGFLSAQVSVQRRQDLSWLWRGARNTMTLAYVRSANSRLGTGLGGVDDLSLTSSIVQKGVNVGFSHRLSAQSSLVLSANRTRSSGVSTGGIRASNQNMLSAGVSTQIGAKTNATLTARRTKVEQGTTPYTENAVVGLVSMQF